MSTNLMYHMGNNVWITRDYEIIANDPMNHTQSPVKIIAYTQDSARSVKRVKVSPRVQEIPHSTRKQEKRSLATYASILYTQTKYDCCYFNLLDSDNNHLLFLYMVKDAQYIYLLDENYSVQFRWEVVSNIGPRGMMFNRCQDTELKISLAYCWKSLTSKCSLLFYTQYSDENYTKICEMQISTISVDIAGLKQSLFPEHLIIVLDAHAPWNKINNAQKQSQLGAYYPNEHEIRCHAFVNHTIKEFSLATLMHELGHALHYSNSSIQEHMPKILNIVKATIDNIQKRSMAVDDLAEYAYDQYLLDPSEIFARLFALYTYYRSCEYHKDPSGSQSWRMYLDSQEDITADEVIAFYKQYDSFFY